MQKFTGKQYLKIDIANNFGHDKLLWDERLAWFDQNESNLENMVNQADEPALFYAGVQAYRNVQKGLPIGYMISLDATSSGLQLLACLTGDRSAAKLCNVLNTGKREDAYTGVYNYMKSIAGMGADVKRDDCKSAIMTAFYGSKAEPKRVFGDGPMLRIFIKAMKTLAPAAWDLNESMPNFWQSDKLSHDWVMPDNFHVHVKVIDIENENFHFMGAPHQFARKINRATEEGRSLSANTIHSLDGMVVREMTRRCNYDPDRIDFVKQELASDVAARLDNDGDHMVLRLWNHYLKSGYLSARILDYISRYNAGHTDVVMVRQLIDSLPKKPFKVISIHDCFRCLPHYGNDLREQYNLQLMLIAKSTILQSMISQIIGKDVTIGKLDHNMWKEIMEAEYALS
jgi:hypothetical protein